MLQKIIVLEILFTSIFIFHILQAIDTPNTPSLTRKTIDQQIPETPIPKSNVVASTPDIEESATPWLNQGLESVVQKFAKIILEALQSSPEVKKVWHLEIESNITRYLFYKLDYAFLKKIRHPVPSAFANVASKCASLFDKLTQKTYFEAVAISLAEFLITENVEPDADLALRYVRYIEKELELADLSDTESILLAYLTAYANFFLSLGYELDTISDKAIQLFLSEVIVLNDLMKNKT